MSHSIRQLPIIFTGLIVGLLLLVGVALAGQSFVVQQQQAIVQQRQVAQRVATQTAAFLQELEGELEVVIRVRGLLDLDRDQQQSILAELLAYQKMFEELTLLDSQGQEQVRISRLEIVTPDQLGSRADKDEFTVPRASGETYYGPVWFDEVTNEPHMTLALPLTDPRIGLVSGVLVADVRFKPIWDLVAGVRTSEGESVYIVDVQGQVIVHRNPSVVLRGTRFQPGPDGLQSGLDSPSVILATDTIPVGQQAFTIVAERDALAALSLAISTVLIITALILAALVVAGGLVFVAMRQIIRPIQNLTTTARAISAGDLAQRAAVSSRNEIGDLARAFNRMTAQLQELVGALEQRVAERTRGLQAAAEVARATTSVLDLDVLLPQIVALIRERFDLYYVGLFLLDDTERFAVLRAGTGDPGRQMLAQGWRLPVGGASMIGQCIASGRADVQLDVGEAAVHFSNPWLPETRSEMALPLRSRGRVIGAMTVQSVAEAAFDQASTAVMQAMADQMAVAIDNARLFAEARAALAEMEATHRRYLGQAWAEYTFTRAISGYEQTDVGMIPLGDKVLPEAALALAERHMAIDEQETPAQSALVVPIMLRGQPIGALGFKAAAGNRQWSDEDIALAEAISEQFALAADNLRLLEEMQQRAARERLTGEITARMRETLDMDTVLKTAAQEIRQVLGLPEVMIRLAPQPSNPGE